MVSIRASHHTIESTKCWVFCSERVLYVIRIELRAPTTRISIHTDIHTSTNELEQEIFIYSNCSIQLSVKWYWNSVLTLVRAPFTLHSLIFYLFVRSFVSLFVRLPTCPPHPALVWLTMPIFPLKFITKRAKSTLQSDGALNMFIPVSISRHSAQPNVWKERERAGKKRYRTFNSGNFFGTMFHIIWQQYHS